MRKNIGAKPWVYPPIAYDPVSHAYVECNQKVGNAFKDGHLH